MKEPTSRKLTDNFDKLELKTIKENLNDSQSLGTELNNFAVSGSELNQLEPFDSE